MYFYVGFGMPDREIDEAPGTVTFIACLALFV
jgi:hypothetical protein